jgi:hypothetical protein
VWSVGLAVFLATGGSEIFSLSGSRDGGLLNDKGVGQEREWWAVASLATLCVFIAEVIPLIHHCHTYIIRMQLQHLCNTSVTFP